MDQNTSVLGAIAGIIARHNPAESILPTAVEGLCLYRRESDRTIDTDSGQMMVSLIAQGSKNTRIGGINRIYHAGECLVCSLAVPAVFHTEGASREEPFLSMSLRIDPAMIADYAAMLDERPVPKGSGKEIVSVFFPEDGLLDAFLRLAKLLDSPADCRALGPLVVREIHYRLLLSESAAALRANLVEGTGNRSLLQVIARIKRTDWDLPAIEDLADEAHMSPSVFRKQFREITGMSPLQYVRRLRLFEGQRKLLRGDTGVSQAAFAVGYSSAGQFIRDYREFFGKPPLQDTKAKRSGGLKFQQQASAA